MGVPHGGGSDAAALVVGCDGLVATTEAGPPSVGHEMVERIWWEAALLPTWLTPQVPQVGFANARIRLGSGRVLGLAGTLAVLWGGWEARVGLEDGGVGLRVLVSDDTGSGWCVGGLGEVRLRELERSLGRRARGWEGAEARMVLPVVVRSPLLRSWAPVQLCS